MLLSEVSSNKWFNNNAEKSRRGKRVVKIENFPISTKSKTPSTILFIMLYPSPWIRMWERTRDLIMTWDDVDVDKWEGWELSHQHNTFINYEIIAVKDLITTWISIHLSTNKQLTFHLFALSFTGCYSRVCRQVHLVVGCVECWFCHISLPTMSVEVHVSSLPPSSLCWMHYWQVREREEF